MKQYGLYKKNKKKQKKKHCTEITFFKTCPIMIYSTAFMYYSQDLVLIIQLCALHGYSPMHPVSPFSALASHYRLHISCPVPGKPPKPVQTAKSPGDKGTDRQTR